MTVNVRLNTETVNTTLRVEHPRAKADLEVANSRM
jgi:hypothetical protein